MFKSINLKRKLIIFTYIILSQFSLIFSLSSNVAAPVMGQTPEEQLQELEQEISDLEQKQAEVRAQIANGQYLLEGYNSQISALYGEILIFQDEINKLELQIEEISLTIDVLDIQIEEKRESILSTERAIVELEVDTEKLISNHYKEFRLYGGQIDSTSLLNTESLATYYKDSQYKELIQSNTNELMVEVAELRIDLELQKKDLEVQIAKVQEDKAKIEAQRKEVDLKKSELDVRIAAFYSEAGALSSTIASGNNTLLAFSREQQEKESEAERIRNQIFNSFSPIQNGEWVTAGRPIGRQGCTGLCTGPHLHFMVTLNGNLQNPCGYIAACGPATLQMPIQSAYSITSWYGNRCFDWGGSLYCDWHNGLDLAGSPWDTVLYAAHDGYAYRGTDVYGANYVIVCETNNCNVGFKTGYWHLSSF